MRKAVMLAAGMLASAVFGVSLAQTPEPGDHRPDDRGSRPGLDGPRLKQELGLSDQQLGDLRKLRLDQRRAAIRRRADAQLARLELQELMRAASVDEKAVQARVKELAELQAGALRARVDAQLAMRKLLTPEQRQKLEQLRAERPRPRFDRPRRDDGPRERRPGLPPGEERRRGGRRGLTDAEGQ